jgi:hypothetical protein
MPKPKTLGRQALELLLELVPATESWQRKCVAVIDGVIMVESTRRKREKWEKTRNRVVFNNLGDHVDVFFINNVRWYWDVVELLATKLQANHIKVGTGLMSAYRHYVRPYATGPRKRIPGSPAKTRREKRIQLELPF